MLSEWGQHQQIWILEIVVRDVVRLKDWRSIWLFSDGPLFQVDDTTLTDQERGEPVPSIGKVGLPVLLLRMVADPIPSPSGQQSLISSSGGVQRASWGATAIIITAATMDSCTCSKFSSNNNLWAGASSSPIFQTNNTSDYNFKNPNLMKLPISNNINPDIVADIG